MSEPGASSRGIDYERLYRFRFRGVDQRARQAAWNEIGPFVHREMGLPARVLDPAAGRREFISAITADERWVVDAVDYEDAALDDSVKVLIGSALDVTLPESYFDGVFVSNLLEHFSTQDEIADFLGRMRTVMAPQGRIAVLGPNFKYCAREYFDCADHTLALTHVAVEEHLYAAGFTVRKVVPRFLPYSFRGSLPAAPSLIRGYLRAPLAWRFLGKQFLLIASND
jgi:ubiquinone/menaquinone biosynthesis C-methylase UbiE